MSLVTGGDMEDEDSNLVSWNLADSHYPVAVYTADPDNSENTVISFTGVSTFGLISWFNSGTIHI